MRSSVSVFGRHRNTPFFRLEEYKLPASCATPRLPGVYRFLEDLAAQKTSLKFSQGLATREVVGNRSGDRRPKAFRVIHFLQMTKLVYDDVIGQMGRQKGDAVIE